MNHLVRSLAAALSFALTASSLPAVSTPVQLYEIAVARFVIDPDGILRRHNGRLDSLGQFKLDEITAVPSTVTVPAEARNRFLISAEAWFAYKRLGPEAVTNFLVDEEDPGFLLGARTYYPVVQNPDAKLDLGDAVNLSARATVVPDGDPLIGGFVIENQHRWVLIRAIGPTLAQFGVAQPLADPHVTIYKSHSNQALYFNNNWGDRFDADEIENAARAVGAFPLARTSKDAALLIELAPGIYTAHLIGLGHGGGTALLEIYVVP